MGDMTGGDKRHFRIIPAGLPTRTHLAFGYPDMEGQSYFFIVRPGWETRVLKEDRKVTTVLSIRHLEEAFNDPSIAVIFIPSDSMIAKKTARFVCRKHKEGKTVFFEEPD